MRGDGVDGVFAYRVGLTGSGPGGTVRSTVDVLSVAHRHTEVQLSVMSPEPLPRAQLQALFDPLLERPGGPLSEGSSLTPPTAVDDSHDQHETLLPPGRRTRRS